jgi:hypothetical protein
MTRRAIRRSSLYTHRPPMGEARRLHIFGKLVPLEIQQLDRERRKLNELGILAGLSVVVSASLVIVGLAVAFGG